MSSTTPPNKREIEKALSSAQKAAPSGPGLSEVKKNLASFNGAIRGLKVGADFRTLAKQKTQLDKDFAKRKKNFERADKRASKEIAVLESKAAKLKSLNPEAAALISKAVNEKIQIRDHVRKMFNEGTQKLYNSKQAEIARAEAARPESIMAAINNTKLLNYDLDAYIKEVKQVIGPEKLQGQAKASYEENLIKRVRYELTAASPARMPDRARDIILQLSKPSLTSDKFIDLDKKIVKLNAEIKQAVEQMTAYKAELTKASPSNAQALAIKNAGEWLEEVRAAHTELTKARAKIKTPEKSAQTTAQSDQKVQTIPQAGQRWAVGAIQAKTLPELPPLPVKSQSNKENKGAEPADPSPPTTPTPMG